MFGISQIVSSWLDLLFPPICALCKVREKNLLCSDCQEWLAPPDPAVRCGHCFVEMGSSAPLCQQCVKSPALQAPRANLFDPSPVASAWKSLLLQEEDSEFARIAASLLILQWGRLNWPLPDRIAIVPAKGKTRQLRSIAGIAAALLDRSLSSEFGLEWIGFFEWRIKRVKDDLLEGKSLLLIDFEGESQWLSQALSELWPAYPKEVYIISLFSGGNIDSRGI